MGGPSAATKAQQDLTLQQTKETMAFDQTLMGLFQEQFANQQDQLNFLKGVLQPVVSDAAAGKGFSDAELAAMRTQATDINSQQFTNAQKALNEKLLTSGSPQVSSGVTVGANTALLEAGAAQEASTQNQITVANAQQARSNLFNAVNSLSGVAAQNNPAPLAGEAVNAGGTVAGLSGSQSSLQNAITNATNSSFFGKLSSGLAQGLGGFLTAGAGNGGLFTNLATG